MAVITGVRAVPVSVPLHRPLVSALGTIHASEYTVLALEDADGRVGLGEVALIWHGNGARLAPLLRDLVAPVLLDREATNRTALMREVGHRLQFGHHTLTVAAAVDMALLDLAGQACGTRVLDLWGGPARDAVPLSMSLSIDEPEGMLAEARRYVSEGFTTLKVKTGGDPDHAVASVAHLRREFHDRIRIRVDLNMAASHWKEALRLVERLAPHDVISIEQPLPPGDLPGMAALCGRSPVPIMADESVWSLQDAVDVVRARAADIVNVYVSEAGGPTQARRIAELCHAEGIGVAIGSMPELGIGTTAAAHVAFSLDMRLHPSDIAGHRYHRADVVRGAPEIADGHLLPPTGTGLGLRLDEAALAEYELETT